MNFLQDQRSELCTALALFQAEVKNIPKSSENPFYRSSYADMATVLHYIGPALGNAGLSVIQGYIAATPDSEAMIKTVVMHKSGEGYESFSPCVMPWQFNKDKQEWFQEVGPQAAGKAQTYARRYGLMAALCLAAGGDDDDGESGQQAFRGNEKTQTKPRPAQKAKPGKPADVRKMTSRLESTCGICEKKIERNVPIAFRRDEGGTGAAAHWPCYEKWQKGQGDAAPQDSPPDDDEAAMHDHAPELGNETGAELLAEAKGGEPEPNPVSVDHTEDLPF